jgi:hypothetical protein
VVWRRDGDAMERVPRGRSRRFVMLTWQSSLSYAESRMTVPRDDL